MRPFTVTFYVHPRSAKYLRPRCEKSSKPRSTARRFPSPQGADSEGGGEGGRGGSRRAGGKEEKEEDRGSDHELYAEIPDTVVPADFSQLPEFQVRQLYVHQPLFADLSFLWLLVFS